MRKLKSNDNIHGKSRRKRSAKRFTGLLLALVVLVVAAINPKAGLVLKAEAAGAITTADFLKANGKDVRKNYGSGETVYLRGTNAGGYLLQEFWMTPTSYSSSPYTVTCEMDIYKTLTSRFGEATMRSLVKTYQDNYWTEQDFDNCKNLGMNVIRLPMWYMNFVDFNGNYISNAF
jgi:endoglucanase